MSASFTFTQAGREFQAQVRLMQSADLKAASALDRLSFSLPWPESAFAYELNENPLSRLWVVEGRAEGQEPMLAAMAVIWLILDEAHIATIAVHPELRGQSIAGHLLTVALRDAAQRGATQATLEVRVSNLSAQALYRRFQFEVVGRRSRYYKDNNEDALIMTAAPLDAAYLQSLELFVPTQKE